MSLAPILISLGVACSFGSLLLLIYCLVVLRRLERMTLNESSDASRADSSSAEGGMNLHLLNPNRRDRRHARRFTDKSRDWLLSREAESRR